MQHSRDMKAKVPILNTSNNVKYRQNAQNHLRFQVFPTTKSKKIELQPKFTTSWIGHFLLFQCNTQMISRLSVSIEYFEYDVGMAKNGSIFIFFRKKIIENFSDRNEKSVSARQEPFGSVSVEIRKIRQVSGKILRLK